MEQENQRDKIIQQLEIMNEKISRQMSARQIFLTGIIYGVGFFVGSAILATIALGVFAPTVSRLSWVQENFERGSSILNSSKEQ